MWEKCDWNEEISHVCLLIFNVLSERKIELHDEIILWVCTHIIENKKISTKIRTAGMDFLLAYL